MAVVVVLIVIVSVDVAWTALLGYGSVYVADDLRITFLSSLRLGDLYSVLYYELG